jgi:putative heme iron utilization protein
VEAEQRAIDHLNADHREAIDLYATRLLGADEAEWHCSGCDPDGLDLRARGKTLRLDFPERVTGPGELRKMLVKLADQARSKR